jgi:hypothetical protein
MSPLAVRTAVLLLAYTGLAVRLPAQVAPEFVVSISPSIVIITQGGMASFTVNVAVNERPSFNFALSRLPSGVIAQAPSGHAGANTIVLTALPYASTGSFSVDLDATAGNNSQKQTFTLNVKPMPITQWEYHVEKALTEQDFQSAAQNLGLQSWELVSVVLSDRDGAPVWIGFFKRQKHLKN